MKVAAPGAEVRARSGYFAFPEAPLAPPRSDHAQIAQLASSQLPATGIGLYLRAEGLDGSTLIAEAQIDLRDINLQSQEGHWSGTVQSIFLQLDSTGQILQVDDRTFHPEFDAATYQQGLQRGITDTRRIRVVPRAAQLCIVVRDAASSRVGSIYVPLAKYSLHASDTSQTKQ